MDLFAAFMVAMGVNVMEHGFPVAIQMFKDWTDEINPDFPEIDIDDILALGKPAAPENYFIDKE